MNETVALVGLAVVLAKTLEKLVDFVLNKFKKVNDKDGPNAVLIEIKKQNAAIYSVAKDILDLLQKTDVNGTPLVYFPRCIEARQLESINLLNDQGHSQENTMKILDKMADRLINMSGTQDQILHEVRK